MTPRAPQGEGPRGQAMLNDTPPEDGSVTHAVAGLASRGHGGPPRPQEQCVPAACATCFPAPKAVR